MKPSEVLQSDLAKKQQELHEFLGDVKEKSFSAEDIGEIKRRNDELDQIEDKRAKAYAEEQEVAAIAAKNRERIEALSTPVDPVGHGGAGRPGAGMSGQPEQKSLGHQFTEHAAFVKAPARRSTTVELPNFEFKTTMTTSAGFAPSVVRTAVVVPYALRRPVVADLIPQDSTTQSAIKYMEETTSTNAADLVAEDGLKPESALAFTERTANMGKIATWIPVTEEQLEDAPQVRALVNNRLTVFLQLEEEDQLLNGTGNINGFHNRVTQTQAKGVDPTPSAIYKAFTKIRFTGFAEPDGVVLHPNDWEPIRLLQDSTGRYIWGDPWVEGIERVWGKPVIVTPAEVENTALVGDFGMFSHISRRTGITIRTTDSHSDYFIYNRLVILAEERLTLEIYRLAAFCKVTGI